MIMTDPIESRPQLPHAGPMHWLDGAEVAAGGEIRAWRTIHADHPFTQDGQFLPSALIELMAQAAAAGAIRKAQSSGKKLRHGVLAAIQEIEILAPVRVGETVTVTGREERNFAGFVSGSFEARVGETPVARARMTFHLTFE
jgi:predicted hotdog family 3-hydroxylacyl-ACP dehydratase